VRASVATTNDAPQSRHDAAGQATAGTGGMSRTCLSGTDRKDVGLHFA